ncbi:hypothetical protein [Streptomyces sp. NPDC002520]
MSGIAGDDRFSEASVLLSVAGEVDGLRSPEFDRKVTDDTYLTWAGESIVTFGSFGVVGTPAVWFGKDVIPVVTIDGDVDITPRKFLDRIQN